MSLIGQSLSLHGAESQIVTLLIFIFTRVAANVLVLSGSQVDTLLVLLLILVVWIILRNALQSVSDAARIGRILTSNPHHYTAGELTDHGNQSPFISGSGSSTPNPKNPGYTTIDRVEEAAGEDEGWADAWSTGMDFISRILVLLTFQVAGDLVLQEWQTAGVTTQEALVLLFLIAIIFFPIFLWIHRTWSAHSTYDRQVFNTSIQQLQAARAVSLHPITVSTAAFITAAAAAATKQQRRTSTGTPRQRTRPLQTEFLLGLQQQQQQQPQQQPPQAYRYQQLPQQQRRWQRKPQLVVA